MACHRILLILPRNLQNFRKYPKEAVQIAAQIRKCGSESLARNVPQTEGKL